MNVLVLSQVFWPDNVAVSLFVTDLCQKLAEKGHQVTVIAGQYDYENHKRNYSQFNKLNNINIIRLKNTGMGKGSILYRLIDFFTFNFLVLLELLSVKRREYDMAISTTVPPMLSFMTALFAPFKKYKFIYWTMDLQPELSIQSGLIKKNSLIAASLTRMGDYVFKKADKILVLDQYMKSHITERCNQPGKILISPLWPVIEKRYYGSRSDNEFRKKYKLQDKLVVMYAGNHSYVHPLNTLLEAGKRLKYLHNVCFVFVGSGVRKHEVTAFRHTHRLTNIIQVPFQPRDQVHISLGASDIQVVILGEQQVGYTHPNKVYGALYAGKPVVYIGPEPSHVTDILSKCPGNIMVQHGQTDLLVKELENWVNNPALLEDIGQNNLAYAEKHLDPEKLKTDLTDMISLF